MFTFFLALYVDVEVKKKWRKLICVKHWDREKSWMMVNLDETLGWKINWLITWVLCPTRDYTFDRPRRRPNWFRPDWLCRHRRLGLKYRRGAQPRGSRNNRHARLAPILDNFDYIGQRGFVDRASNRRLWDPNQNFSLSTVPRCSEAIGMACLDLPAIPDTDRYLLNGENKNFLICTY